MEINPKSKKADEVGNLYRSALFLLKGQNSLAISFLEKACLFFKEPKLKRILVQIKKQPSTEKKSCLLAEKILDCYHLLKSS